jgi:tetratricopeptide (TPR) repeat protein
VTADRGALPVALSVTLAAALLAGAGALAFAREQRYPPSARQDVQLYLTSGTTLRRLTAGYNAIAADLYWIRSVQYFGDRRLKNGRAVEELRKRSADPPPQLEHPEYFENYDLLFPLLDVTTSLDPHFKIAYRFGSLFLAEPAPGGAGRPDLAIKLLEKGLAVTPDKWEYMLDVGFIHYWWTHDYRSAADWFQKASQVADAPSWLRPLAAATLARGGDRRSSRAMWEALRASADNDWIRDQAEWRLLQLQALDEIDGLQRLVDRARTSGVTVDSWQSLRLRGIPLDPTGVPYALDPDGRVHLQPTSRLLPLPDEPTPRLAPPS